MVIVDTTVWIDYLGGFLTPEVAYLENAMGLQRLGLTELILCEVLQGIRDNASYSRVRRNLLNFEVFSSGGLDIALASSEHYRFLRAKGITVRKTIDCFIASFCILAKHSLLHRDRDFDPFERHLGLRVVHPERD